MTSKPALVALRDRRDEVIEILSDAFAGGVLELDAFDERVSLAHRADSVAALDRLVEDLAPIAAAAEGPGEALAPAAETVALEVQRPASRTLVSVMGGVDRKGAWRVPKRLRVFTLMGGTDLDLREVQLPPGVTEIKIAAIMGGVDVIVPPDLAVEAHGWAIMGGFDGLDRAPARPDPDRPLVRISGFALMGGISVKTRLPGESGLQAWRRQRRERKQLRERAMKRLSDGDDSTE